jgi:hypothetical protein
MKPINHQEALEILDSLEQRNLLHAQSRVLADIIRDGKCGTPAPDEAAKCGTFSACIEEADGNFHGYVWSFERIMSYLRIAFMPQLSRSGL